MICSTSLMEHILKVFALFLTGMAEGFDLLATEAVLKLKTVHTDIRLIAVIPFARQAYRYSKEDQLRYAEIFKQCDDSVLISEHYYKGCFHRRNDYLIDNASSVIAYFDGQPSGGTFYTIQRAMTNKIPVRNLIDCCLTHDWWSSLDIGTKALFSGIYEDTPTQNNRKFWLSVHPTYRSEMFAWWIAKTGKVKCSEDYEHEMFMEIVSELAELTMEREFNVSSDEMYNKEGNYLEKFQDRFNDLYDEIEDRLSTIK